jgi:MFS family permease
MIVVPFLPGRAKELGASPLITGALFAAYAGGLFLATPPGGWITDRVGARQTLLLGLVALFGATLCFAFAPGLPLLFVARASQGVAGAITWTAGLALVAQLYGPGERPIVFARILMAGSAGTLLGPPLGGTLYTLGGFRAPFLVAAGLVLLDGLGRLLFLPGRRVLAPAVRQRGVIRALFHDGRFLTALLVTLVGAGLLALLEPTIPPLLTARFGVRPLVIGALFGGLTVVFTVAQPMIAYATRRFGAELAMVLGLVIGALGLILIAKSGTLLDVVLALVEVAFGAAFLLVPTLEVLALSGPSGQGEPPAGRDSTPYGAIFAAYNLAYGGGLFLGPLLAGVSITWLGPTHGLTLLSVAVVVVGFLVFWRRGAVRLRIDDRQPVPS